MPVPVSVTRIRHPPAGPGPTSTVMDPWKVNLTALDSRFNTTVSHIATSTSASTGPQFSTSSIPARSHSPANEEAICAVSAPRSTMTNDALTRPASMRENSSSELTSRSSRPALRRAVSSRSRWAGSSPVAAIASSSGPRSNVNGVRNSWLTLVRKAVLARSSSASASARRRCCSYESAVANAADTWSASSRQNPWYCSSSGRRGFSPTTRHPVIDPGAVSPSPITSAFCGQSSANAGGSAGTAAARSSTTCSNGRDNPGSCGGINGTADAGSRPATRALAPRSTAAPARCWSST